MLSSSPHMGHSPCPQELGIRPVRQSVVKATPDHCHWNYHQSEDSLCGCLSLEQAQGGSRRPLHD